MTDITSSPTPGTDDERVKPRSAVHQLLVRPELGAICGTVFPLWMSILATFALCCALGALNGYLVIRTRLPSFIVTLAFLFILRGLTIWIAILTTRETVVSGIGELAAKDPLAWLFGGKVLTGLFRWLGDHGWLATYVKGSRAGQPIVDGVPMLVMWAIGLVIFGHWLLTRTKVGNWIYASGGDAQAARFVGVPVNRVKIAMFVFHGVLRDRSGRVPSG